MGDAAPGLAAIRPAGAEDHAGVQALFARHGWPVRSRHGWEWALLHNPAREALGAVAGWVLESQGQIVGFLGNIPQAYRLDGQPVWAATCTSYLVDSAHRTSSVQLMRAFAAQQGVTFVHSGTANAHSAPVYQLYKFKPLVADGLNQTLRWVACDAAFITAGLARKGLGAAAGVLHLVAPLMRAVRHGLQWATPPKPSETAQVDVLSAEQLGEEWDAWANAQAAQPGLWLDRSARTMAWRLGDPDQDDRLVLLALRQASGKLVGMCMLRDVAADAQAVPKAELMDWAVLPGTPRAERAALLLGALAWAAQRGLAVLDAKRHAGQPLAGLSDLNPAYAALPGAANWALVRDARWRIRLSDTAAWHMAGADGDDWFNTHQHPERPGHLAWAATPQASSEAPSCATNSLAVPTAEGSNRSMSTSAPQAASTAATSSISAMLSSNPPSKTSGSAAMGSVGDTAA
jgi:hypothetical protein